MSHFLKKIIVLLFISPIVLYGQSAISVLQNNKMKIGEHNELRISLSVLDKKAKQIIWPNVAEILTNSSLDTIQIGKVDSLFDEKHVFKGWQQQIIFSAFDSNNYWIPAFEFFSINGNDTDFIAVTDSLMLSVTTVPVDTTKAFKDIKGPMDEPIRFFEVLPYVIAFIVLIIIAILSLYLYRKYKRKEPLFKLIQKPTIKPSVWALEQLSKLKNKKLWQQGFVKEYYVELTEIIRRYYQEEFNFNALEMTSSEIVKELKEINFDKEVVNNFSKISEYADLAKFAKSSPIDIENEQCMLLSVEVIQLSQQFKDKTDALINAINAPESKGGKQ